MDQAPNQYPDPVRRDYKMPDGVLSAVHFGRTQNPLKIVFLHANGFNSLAYRQLFHGLGVHAIALDLRGHGFTKLPTNIDELNNYHIFRDDIITFFRDYIKSPVILAGHSYGAVSGILASPFIQDKLRAYVGFDPVSLPLYGRMFLNLPAMRKWSKNYFSLSRNAGRRKSVFPSIDAAFERYHNRGAFRGVPDEVLNDYLTGGLELRGQAYHLRCDPLWEQAIYVAQDHNLYKAAKALPDNSHIIYAGKFALASTPSTRRLVQKSQPNMQVTFDTELAHLFPLQNPDLAAQLLRDVLAKTSLG